MEFGNGIKDDFVIIYYIPETEVSGTFRLDYTLATARPAMTFTRFAR